MRTPLFPFLMPPVRFEERVAGKVLVVAFGGGLNSVAMGILLVRAGIRPDWIGMADTGGERPETWEIVTRFSLWLMDRGFPPVSVVRNRPKKHPDLSLEDECLRTSSLPSKAYGWSKCSEKWKIRPQTAAIRLLPAARAEWKEKRKVVKLIGIDAGEARRVKYPTDNRFEHEYPLVEWGIFREDCEAIAASEGFTVPKSACFFCPSMRKPEILALRAEHPDLMARALAMEAKAKPGLLTVNGLGRRLNWADFLAGEPVPEDAETPEQDCGCYDG